MSKATITGYTLRLRKKGTKDEYKKLMQFSGNNNLYDILYDFLNNGIGESNIKSVGDKKTIFYDELNKINSNCINFIAKIGRYGEAYKLFNYVTKKLTYKRGKDDTDAFPLQFTIYIPDINDEYSGIGILISEKYKNKSAKGLFETNFKEYFSKNFKDYIIDIDPIIPEEFLAFFDRGFISKTTIKSHSIPNDIADSYTSGEDSKNKAYIELTIKNKDLKKHIKSFIFDKLKNKKHIDISKLFTGYLITPEEVSFSGTLDGKQTTIILKDEEEMMVPSIDITKRVDSSLDEDGFPNKTLIKNIEIEYLNYFKKIYKDSIND